MEAIPVVNPPPVTPAALNAVGRSGLWWMAKECAKRGWSVDGAFALIAEESGWNPRAKVPPASGSAAGLFQATNATAKSLGFRDSEALRMASGRSQLRAAFRYWDKMAKAARYTGPSSFFLWGLGGAAGEVLYPAGSLAAKVNPHLQDASGAITRTRALSFFAPHVARAAKLPRCPRPVPYVKIALGVAAAVSIAGVVREWYGGNDGEQ